jgi:ubiquinone/menaquinone biosynthesis C-methylase UbiE
MSDIGLFPSDKQPPIGLVCPNGCGRIVFDKASLHCPICREDFPIINGIPLLFTNELRKKYQFGTGTAQSYYRKVPNEYDKTHSVTKRGAQLFIKELENKLSQYLTNEQSVLEIGSGTGFATACIFSLNERMVITDASLEMLSINHARHPGISVVCSPSEVLPFPEGSFDVIFGNNSFYLVANKDQSAQRISDILIDEGRLIISEMNPFHLLWPLRFMLSGRWFESGIYEIFPYQMKIRFKKYGMKLETVEFYSFYPYFASERFTWIFRFIEQSFGKINFFRRFLAFRVFYVLTKEKNATLG